MAESRNFLHLVLIVVYVLFMKSADIAIAIMLIGLLVLRFFIAAFMNIQLSRKYLNGPPKYHITFELFSHVVKIERVCKKVIMAVHRNIGSSPYPDQLQELQACRSWTICTFHLNHRLYHCCTVLPLLIWIYPQSHSRMMMQETHL